MKIYQSLSPQEIKRVKKVLSNYNFDLSKISIKRNIVASINEVYLIEAGNKKYILRRSEVDKTLKHLQFEIEVLNYLHEREFALTPYVFPNKQSKLITIFEKRYYILFNFMPGKTRANWNNLSHFNTKQLVNLFLASAKFTNAVAKFQSKISDHNYPLYYYLTKGQNIFQNQSKAVKNPRIRKLLLSNKKFIENFVRTTKKEFEDSGYDNLPKQVVHFDLHPGNVNYQDNRVVGIFDFDWARRDSRISDIAATIAQSCYNFGGPNSGLYVKEKIQIGLEAYRKAYGKSEFGMRRENHFIKIALKAYMYFQLFWCLDWHINNPRDLRAYKYFDFFIRVLKLNDFDRLFEL